MKRIWQTVVVVAGLIGAISIGHADGASSEQNTAERLQELIDQAQAGDVVILPGGTYYGGLHINQPLEVRTDGSPVHLIQHDEIPAITVSANDVRIEGLSIESDGRGRYPAVKLSGDRLEVDGLTIMTASHGIWLSDSVDAQIVNTKVSWHEAAAPDVKLTEKGNGIDLYQTSRTLLVDNEIMSMHDGIYLESSDNSEIARNQMFESRYGVHLMYTNTVSVHDNVGQRNVTGAMLMVSDNVQLHDNQFARQQENVNAQGILLFDVTEVDVFNNEVGGNRIGLLVENSKGNRIFDNRINDNVLGLLLLSSQDNLVTDNTLWNNVTDVQARTSGENEVKGNYWDSFRGLDLDGDGYSDWAYTVNPFFQSVVTRKPPFQLFYDSPGMRLLEELFQSNREQWARDVSPMMMPQADRIEAPHSSASNRVVMLVLSITLLLSAGILVTLGVRRVQ